MLTLQETKYFLKEIAKTKDFNPTPWEKRFLMKIRVDARKGMTVSWRESIDLHKIYRRAKFDRNDSPFLEAMELRYA